MLNSACGYATCSLMPTDAVVLSIELKINLLAPAAGDSFHFLGRLRRVGGPYSWLMARPLPWPPARGSSLPPCAVRSWRCSIEGLEGG